MVTNQLKAILIIAVSLGLGACGQDMTTAGGALGKSSGSLSNGSGGNTGSSGGSTGIAPNVDQIHSSAIVDANAAEAEAVQVALEAEAALNRIGVSSSGVSYGGTTGNVDQQIIIDKLIKKVLDRVADKLDFAPEKLDQIRTRLNVEMAKLDPLNPLHLTAIATLTLAMDRVDMVEARYYELLGKVADAIDMLINKLDLLAAQVPFPANILVAVELNDVKIVLREFQSKLRG